MRGLRELKKIKRRLVPHQSILDHVLYALKLLKHMSLFRAAMYVLANNVVYEWWQRTKSAQSAIKFQRWQWSYSFAETWGGLTMTRDSTFYFLYVMPNVWVLVVKEVRYSYQSLCAFLSIMGPYYIHPTTVGAILHTSSVVNFVRGRGNVVLRY